MKWSKIFFLQVTLNNYTFENVAFHVLHQRFPLYSQRTLSDWFDHNSDLFRFGLVNTSNLYSRRRLCSKLNLTVIVIKAWQLNGVFEIRVILTFTKCDVLSEHPVIVMLAVDQKVN